MTSARLGGDAGIIVVADHPQAAAAGTAAVNTADARLLAVVPWAEALKRAVAQAAPTILLLETDGVADDMVVRTFSALKASTDAARILVAFSLDRLDALEGVLIGSGATLLCDATLAERVVALVTAVQADQIDLRENRDEMMRLARISAEIARFTETLAQLTGAPQGARAAAERQPIPISEPHDPGRVLDADAGNVTAAEIRRAIRARRLRDEVIGQPGLFEDPAWDMMLDLFAAELERQQVSVSSLCIAAAVPPTTALRWINKLIAVGLFERRPDDFDRRRAYVALTELADAALHRYFAALRRASLSIA